MDKKTKVYSYEKDMQRLREIVDTLAKGGIALDEMMKLYEEGAALTDRCRKTLDDYEARLIVIDKKASNVREDGEDE